MRRDALADAFGEIFRGAFGIGAVGGGISGAAIRHCIGIGLRRGIFSNEAGLGSSALLHASAEDGNARTQGLFAIFEVFADTILCCTLTALVLLTTNVLPSGLDALPWSWRVFQRLWTF